MAPKGGSGRSENENCTTRKDMEEEKKKRKKRNQRKELLERKKAIDGAIRAASSVNDHLDSFSAFRHYNRNGLSIYCKSGRGHKLSSSLKQYIQSLLKVSNESDQQMSMEVEKEKAAVTSVDKRGSIVGFVHFRFILEEDVPVLYVYELQLELCVQGKGLGKFLMLLIELIARKNHMGAVVLTVQKANTSAMNFYISKLRYNISAISPSRVDPLMGIEQNYEILCKAFDDEAKSVLEDASFKYPGSSTASSLDLSS